MSHNLKSLKRKESVDELYTFTIGNNYCINNREEPLKYKMIDGIDDVIEWASAQVPPTPLYLGGTVEREREGEREREERERWMDG